MRQWTRGRGALGILTPLMGNWQSMAVGAHPASMIACNRCFTHFGKGFVRLDASWAIDAHRTYREIAMFGPTDDGLSFWSFTNDGKRSTGIITDATDIHPDAIAFKAQMPAGSARMVYWPPDSETGFRFAVESETKKGWRRFLEHLYKPVSDGEARIP